MCPTRTAPIHMRATLLLSGRMLVYTFVCLALITFAALSFRATRESVRALGWVLLAVGLGGLALLAAAQFMGRLGPEHFWFREPTFYVASIVLLCACIWWLSRPAPAALRFGLPAGLMGLGCALVVLGRADGRSMPLAMSMPTRGVVAPDLTYFDSTGRTRSLAELRGQVVLLNFWATWCTPCRREMPLLAKVQRKHADRGVVVLYVSLEEPEVLGPFLAQHRFDGVQGRLAHADDFYGAGRFYPLSFLISRDGRVAYRWSGRPREDWLMARVDELVR